MKLKQFLLIGLPAQLPKIADPTLLTPSNVTVIKTADSARNLGVIFDSTLSMSHHSLLCLNSFSSNSILFNPASPPVSMTYSMFSTTETLNPDTATLQRPSVSCRQKVTDKSFTLHAPVMVFASSFVNQRPIIPVSIKPASLYHWLYLRFSFMRNSKRSSATDHSFLSLCALG